MKLKFVFILLLLLLLPTLIEAYEIAPYPDSLDYRDFMDENWMTSVKNQLGCGSCWAFATVGALEGTINLYYNQHLDVDLSEQQLVSNDGICCEDCGDCGGGSSSNALSYMQNVSIIDEECFSYVAEDISCNLCEEESNNWRIDSKINFNPSLENKIKSTLNNQGPGSIVVWSWHHAMTFVGYDDSNNLIIKNSWGDYWGDEGYVTLEYDKEDMAFNFLLGPYSPLNPIEASCSDQDNDNYCYWGLSNDTSNCGDNCISRSNGLLKDIDDNNEEAHNLIDLWICDQSSLDSSINVNSGIQNIEIPICFIGNFEQTAESIVNFYINGALYQTQEINLESGEMETINFILDSSDLVLTSNDLLFEVESLEGETIGYNSDNFLESEIWAYNYGEGFTISEDNYVFDCATNQNPEGHPIEMIVGGFGNTGIRFYSVNNGEIRNCVVAGEQSGIYLHYSSNNFLFNNTLLDNAGGLSLYHSSNNIISDNYLINNLGVGVHLYTSSNNNTLSNNFIFNNYWGIRLDQSSTNLVYDNIIESNSDGIFLDSAIDTNISNNVVENNDVGIYSLSSINNPIFNNIFLNNEFGIVLENSTETFISNNNFTGWILSENDLNNYDHYGIKLISSFNNLIDNNFINDSFRGIILSYSSFNNNISYNTIQDSYTGIFLDYSSFNNSISSNVIQDNPEGIFISSNNTLIFNNIIENNQYGIYLDLYLYNNNISNNLICDNSQIDFTCSALSSTMTTGTNNLFDTIIPCNDEWPVYGENYCYCNEIEYEGGCCLLGDITLDGSIDVGDIVRTVSYILNSEEENLIKFSYVETPCCYKITGPYPYTTIFEGSGCGGGVPHTPDLCCASFDFDTPATFMTLINEGPYSAYSCGNLNNLELSPQELCAADYNQDGEIDVLDIVALVDYILNNGAEPETISNALQEAGYNIPVGTLTNSNALRTNIENQIQ